MPQEYFGPDSFDSIQRSGTRRLPLRNLAPSTHLNSTRGPSFGGVANPNQTLTPNLTLGHNGNLPAHISDSSPSSPTEEHGTITEFYGPRPRSPSQRPYLNTPPAARPPLSTSVWSVGSSPAQQQQSPRPPQFSGRIQPKPSPAKPHIPTLPGPNQVTPLEALNGYQTFIDCPWCDRRSLIRLEEENGDATMRRCQQMLPILCFGALIPMIYKWCQDLAHYCATCNRKVALQRYSIEERGLCKPEVFWPPGKQPVVKSQYRKHSGRGMDGRGAGGGTPAATGELPADSAAAGVAESTDTLHHKSGIVEIEGKSRADAEMAGTEAANELDPSRGGGGERVVFEMEHVNRGVGTQKRIRRALGRKWGKEEEGRVVR